jgi:hypothetical protein
MTRGPKTQPLDDKAYNIRDTATSFMTTVSRYTYGNGPERKIKIHPGKELNASKDKFQPQTRSLKSGHESFDILIPSEEKVEIYKSGRSNVAPLRVVLHFERGINNSRRGNPNKSSRGTARNVFGGFYMQ